MVERLVLLWPNIEAGANGGAKAIRRFREHDLSIPLHADKTFKPDFYISIVAKPAAGNSLSFARGASYLGTPVVLIGSRSDGCEFCPAVNRVEPSRKAILTIRQPVEAGRYGGQSLRQGAASRRGSSTPWGAGPYMQKRLHFNHKAA